MQGDLSAFVRQKPEAQSYYELAATPISFVLPEPGFLEGVKSKDRAILKMAKVLPQPSQMKGQHAACMQHAPGILSAAVCTW